MDHGRRRQRRRRRQPVRLALDDTSRSSPGQTLALPAAGTTVRLAIAATAAAPGSGDGLVATGLDAVGFAEIDAGLGPTVEVTRPPTDWLASIGTGQPARVPIDHVLTRLRADPANRWRRDPEPRMVRDVTVPHGHDATAEVTRASRRAGGRSGARRAARARRRDSVRTAHRDAECGRLGGHRRRSRRRLGSRPSADRSARR